MLHMFVHHYYMGYILYTLRKCHRNTHAHVHIHVYTYIIENCFSIEEILYNTLTYIKCITRVPILPCKLKNLYFVIILLFLNKCFLISLQMYLIVSTLIICLVSANYAYEHSKSLSYSVDVPQISSKHDIYESASSETLPHYKSYESSQNRYRDHFESPSERFPTSIKKNLFEKKNLKKTKIPFLTSNKDYTKYKELLLDSEIVHCQEIKVKSIGKDDEIPKDVTTCYKCEDPKTKSMYKRCLHNILPKESTSDNTKMERFSSTPVSLRYRRYRY